MRCAAQQLQQCAVFSRLAQQGCFGKQVGLTYVSDTGLGYTAPLVTR
jgi:hypothetical protein